MQKFYLKVTNISRTDTKLKTCSIQVEEKKEFGVKRMCSQPPNKPRDRFNCSWIDAAGREIPQEWIDKRENQKKHQNTGEEEEEEKVVSPETEIAKSLNKLLDEEEIGKEEQEEQDGKKHYLAEVEDEKVAEDNGHELDDEGHGKDLNRQWRRGGQAG